MLKSVRSTFEPVLVEGMCYETFVRRPSDSGAGALAAGKVMTGKEDFMSPSFMPPLMFMDMEDRRAHVSYSLTNVTLKKGRRFWERYIEENEREDREREKEEGP